MRLINWFNFDSLGSDVRELFTLPSKTVPDMSLSIRDLVDRHKKGLNVKTFSPVYSERNIGLERLDKIERAELAMQLSDFVATSRGRLLSARQKVKQDALEAAVIAEYVRKQAANDVEKVGSKSKVELPINEGASK